MSCALCSAKEKLVKSHAIPAAFFREADIGPETPRLYSNVEGRHPKRAPVGVYDRFACAGCEKLFQAWDDYAIRLFIQGFGDFRRITIDKDVAFFQKDTYQYSEVKLFFISLLLRAHLSCHEFYENVDLGRYADTAKSAVLAGDPGEINTFTVVLSRWRIGGEKENFAKVLVSPFREKWDGVNAYRFYLGLTVAYIKVDKRVFDEAFRNIALAPERPLYIVEREFEISKDFAALKRIAKSANGN